MTKPKTAKKAAPAKPKTPVMIEVGALRPGDLIIWGVRRQRHQIIDARAARLAGFHVIRAKNLTTGYVTTFTTRSLTTVRVAK